MPTGRVCTHYTYVNRYRSSACPVQVCVGHVCECIQSILSPNHVAWVCMQGTYSLVCAGVPS